MSEETKVQDEGLDILNIFNEQSSSNELKAGIHERVKLISVDSKRRKDNNGNLIKKQLFLKFKKFTKEGLDIGEKEVSFFLIDPSRDTAISNLHMFLAQTTEIMALYLSDDQINANFDPLKVLVGKEDERSEEQLKNDFDFENIKKVELKKLSLFTKIELEICKQFDKLLKDHVGFESKEFRLKLEDSKDSKYVQIPRYDRFVESEDVEKEVSALYNKIKK
jgi:hypothetical protein